MKKPLIIGSAILVLVLVLALIIVFGQSKPASAPGLGQVETADPQRFHALNVELALQDLKGKIRWKLKISRIEEKKSGTDLFLITGLYFPEEGAEPLELKAKTGQINPDMNRLELNTGVHMERAGFALQGQKLIWSAKDGGIRMTEGVTVTANNFEGRGNSLVSDAHLKKFRFEGENVWRVSAPLHSEGGR